MQPINPILNVDSYKVSHYLQYPPGTEYVSSYVESRGGPFHETLFFGLQAFLRQYLAMPVTAEHIVEAEALLTAHGLPFNRSGWEYIVKVHGGRLPLEIRAVREGSVVPIRNVLVQVVNTDPNVPWLTSYVETALLRALWYPVTVATLSFACKRIIYRYLSATADSFDSLPFKLHDFGARGVSSAESAALGGLAHLVNFQGTDTVAALLAARAWYDEDMAGYSIPAAEHSTMTAWGQDREADAYANMLRRFGGPGRAVAVVSDSYDLWHAIGHIWGVQLREAVINHGGTLIVRPDSGDPVQVVADAVELLMQRFGAHHNNRGYRVLPDYLRVIQGDGINLQTIQAILSELKRRRLSADNVAFGMGGALLQKVNRDTLQFAMKASAIAVAGEWRDIQKTPITDPGKRSKPGRLALVNSADGYRTVRREELGRASDQLETVFRNGEIMSSQTLADIRMRAHAALLREPTARAA